MCGPGLIRHGATADTSSIGCERMSEPIELTYDLHPLPAGRVPFRRWRWELWHGQHMLAAGWRTTALHAQRALRRYALHHVHRLHGVHLLHADAGSGPEDIWGHAPVTVASGHLSAVLTRRDSLEDGRARLATA